jgi:hypothetical protein
MSPSEKINEETREEWRELGFFYETREQPPCWRFVGSVSGLSRFVQLLDEYVADTRNALLTDHKHYGPYMYLKVQTADFAEIDQQSIRGTLPDLTRLRDLVAASLGACSAGATFSIASEYSRWVTYPLMFEVQPEGFDPASADPEL